MALALTPGCAGSIDDPGDYSFPSAAGCDAPAQVLTPRCAGCHAVGSSQLGGLDLASPGIAQRLAGVPSATCAGQTLLVPGDPDASYLVRKLSPTPPACGNAMPLGGQLPAADLACVERWVAGLAATDGG